MAGGNYGSNSIPTVAIKGADIGAAAYANYRCTTAFATVAGGAFIYGGVTFNFTDAGSQVELIMDASGISGTDNDLVFLCYDCSCNSPMTGTTLASAFYTGTTAMFRPTIIGGGGLNS